MGMAVKTELARVTLPTKERVAVFHPESLEAILSMRGWKRSGEDLPWMEGVPRYVPKSWEGEIPASSETLLITSGLTPREKWMHDF